jgi:hypothetical protein
VDRPNECFRVSEGLMLEMMRFEVMPDTFDIVQFGRIEQNDVADLGLLLAQLQARPTRSTSVALWRPFSVWRGPPPAELFLQGLGQLRTADADIFPLCDLSARSREIVQLCRSATGASGNGVATRNAASLFTGTGPGATLAFSAPVPSRMKSLRHRRTVFSRTPNASAMCGLDQPAQRAGKRRQRGTLVVGC